MFDACPVVPAARTAQTAASSTCSVTSVRPFDRAPMEDSFGVRWNHMESDVNGKGVTSVLAHARCLFHFGMKILFPVGKNLSVMIYICESEKNSDAF